MINKLTYTAILIALMSTSFFRAQENVFLERNVSLAKHFKSVESLRKKALNDVLVEVSAREGLVINDLLKSGSKFTRSVNLSGRIIFNSVAGDYINQLKSKLLKDYPVIDEKIAVFITKDPYMNAFATVNWNIYVNIGLLARVENEAQLAFILAHEIMHIVNSHSIETTIELTKDLERFYASDIQNADEFQALRFHSMSRINETEADKDGFELYLRSGYSSKDAIQALKILKKSRKMFLETDQIQNLLMFESTIEFDSLFLKFSSADFDIDTNTLLQTHPHLDLRILELENSTIKTSSYPTYILTDAEFDEIKNQAIKKIPELYAGDFDFPSLFLYSSAKLIVEKDDSEKNIDYLNYALFGMMHDKLANKSIEDYYAGNKSDSILRFFYRTSTNQEYTKWTTSVSENLQKNYPTEKGEKTLKIIQTRVKKELEGKDNSWLYTDSVKTASTENLLAFDNVEFNVFVHPDIKQLGEVKKFNQHNKSDDIKSGKLALISLNAYNAKVHLMILDVLAGSSSGMGDITESLSKKSRFEKRINRVFNNLEKDDSARVVNMVPNPEEYYGNEWVKVALIKNFIQEKLYFGKESYVSLLNEEMNTQIINEGLEHAMISLHVSTHALGLGELQAMLFTSLAIPIYAPAYIGNAFFSANRKFQLSLIFNLKTGQLEMWDRRTYVEPNSKAQLHVIYNDIIKTFFND